MPHITFYKFSGTGNDFIIIDNRNRIVEEKSLPDFAAKLCRRKMSVGADGLILIENSDVADFRWHFFNSDGSTAEMCGNGARCAARFAYMNDIAGREMSFETLAGMISAEIIGEQVKIKMTDPGEIHDYVLELENGSLKVSSINTGVPHAVIFTEEIRSAPVLGQGREIRFHKAFAPAGTNVNFVSRQSDGSIVNRTYERGVEDETLACGTGCVAAALVTAHQTGTLSPIRVLTGSGAYLTIHYEEKNGLFCNVYLQGDARIIYKGELYEDAWH